MVDRRVVQRALVEVVERARLIARAHFGDRVEHTGVDVERAHDRAADCRRGRSRRQIEVRDDRVRHRQVRSPVGARAIEDDIDVRRVARDEGDARIVEVEDAEVVADRAADHDARWRALDVEAHAVAVAVGGALVCLGGDGAEHPDVQGRDGQ
jgi:hypothetical protein